MVGSPSVNRSWSWSGRGSARSWSVYVALAELSGLEGMDIGRPDWLRRLTMPVWNVETLVCKIDCFCKYIIYLFMQIFISTIFVSIFQVIKSNIQHLHIEPWSKLNIFFSSFFSTICLSTNAAVKEQSDNDFICVALHFPTITDTNLHRHVPAPWWTWN